MTRQIIIVEDDASIRRSLMRYAIDAAFPALKVKEGSINGIDNQRRSLSPEAVDRLRAAGTIILASPEFQHLLLDAGARVLAQLQLAQRG